MRKCAKCGLDLSDASTRICPACGTSLVVSAGGKIWIRALIQFVFAAGFMLLFGFPKIMIAIFGGIILLGALLSSTIRANTARKLTSPRQILHPVRFRIVGIGIAVSTIAIGCCLLFGFVIFMDSWNRWHQYEGQPYHRSEFQVRQVYWQHHTKSVDVYASGMVEGQREWMSLRPYLQPIPRSQNELERRVPEGTVIPIYFFPGLKGRSRVELYQEVPPEEASHRAAITAANDSLLGLAIAGGLLFVLKRVQRSSYQEDLAGLQQAQIRP